jgi:3-oxoacyl-[acyl-carrier protein] reductase
METIMPDLKKTAIVTGASRGIGAAVAERLGRDGFAVVINYADKPEAAKKLSDKIEAAGGRSLIARADVTDSAAMEAMFEQAASAFGGVDVLVNNAGIMKLSSIAETDDATFDEQMAVNLKGVFNGLRLAARRLRDGGRIVSFSSSVVGLYQPTYGVYAAAKAAIEAMTHVLSKELGKRGITVNAIAPGPIETQLFMKGKEKAEIDKVVGLTALGRLGQPEDIARAISFLVGPDGAWINGQILRANGGII